MEAKCEMRIIRPHSTRQRLMSCFKICNTRSDDQLALFWERTTCSADTLGIQEPKLTRRRQPPRRTDSGAEVTTYNEPVDCYFRGIYIHFVDCVAGCITARFSQRGFYAPQLCRPALLRRVLAMGILSVCLSVCHDPVRIQCQVR